MTQKMETFEDDIAKRFAKGISKCRTCNHTRLVHYKSRDCIFVNSDVRKTYSYKRCKCHEFLPLDNLEYLEFMNSKNKKKGKKSK